MKKFSLSELLVTWFYVGKIPFAPGTMGSLAALPLAYLLHRYGGLGAMLLATLAVTVVGSVASHLYMKEKGGDHDPGEIVIDEVAGQWLLLCLLLPVYELAMAWKEPGEKGPSLLLVFGGAFLVFRLFDIVKPWPISWADRKVKGGFGVMFDDLLAALYPIALLALFSLF